MLHTLLIVIHVLICIMLSVVVLLQASKGGGLAGAFGGGGGAPQQLLGSRGMTTLLHKVTIYLAVGFFTTSFLLFITDTSGGPTRGGVIGDAAEQGEITSPVQDLPLEQSPEAPATLPADDAGGTSDAGGTDVEDGGGN